MKLAKLFTAAALITAVSAQPALAQQKDYQKRNAQEMQGMHEQQKIKVNDKEINRYVKARENVNDISKNKRGKIAQMSPREREELNQELVKAIKDSGLSIARYNAISTAMLRDADLEQRIIQAMDES